MTWDEKIIGEDEMLYSSGKRIKQLEFLDSADNVVSKKTYDYNQSGVILSIPYFGVPHDVYGNAGAIMRGAAIPGSPFSTYQGNTIGYRFVEEFDGNSDENAGMTSYRFLVTKDTGDYMSYPVTPPTDNEWLRGLPYETVLYRRNTESNNYTAVKKVQTSYLSSNDDYENVIPIPFQYPNATPSNLLTPYSVSYNIDSIPQTLPDILYQKTSTSFRLPIVHRYLKEDVTGNPNYLKIYHFTGGTLDVGRTVETYYDDLGAPTLVKETENGYNYAKHYQLSSATSVSSDGEPISKVYTYPQQLESGYTVHPLTYSYTNTVKALAEQHRFVPLSTSTYKDSNSDGNFDLSEIMGKTETNFQWHGNILELSSIKTSKGTEACAGRIEFERYDDHGNLLQVSKSNGMDITYIYGYDSTLPVAKIENATYAQVQAYVANIQSKSDLDDDTCADSVACDEKNLRTALNALRNAMPNAMVTSYTYDPLIGITSLTDHNGNTVYYQYDDLNRLKRVIDNNGKILTKKEYRYLLDN